MTVVSAYTLAEKGDNDILRSPALCEAVGSWYGGRWISPDIAEMTAQYSCVRRESQVAGPFTLIDSPCLAAPFATPHCYRLLPVCGPTGQQQERSLSLCIYSIL